MPAVARRPRPGPTRRRPGRHRGRAGSALLALLALGCAQGTSSNGLPPAAPLNQGSEGGWTGVRVGGTGVAGGGTGEATATGGTNATAGSATTGGASAGAATAGTGTAGTTTLGTATVGATTVGGGTAGTTVGTATAGTATAGTATAGTATAGTATAGSTAGSTTAGTTTGGSAPPPVSGGTAATGQATLSGSFPGVRFVPGSVTVAPVATATGTAMHVTIWQAADACQSLTAGQVPHGGAVALVADATAPAPIGAGSTLAVSNRDALCQDSLGATGVASGGTVSILPIVGGGATGRFDNVTFPGAASTDPFSGTFQAAPCAAGAADPAALSCVP